MKKASLIIAGSLFLSQGLWADSLLSAEKFPKTFSDLSFVDRLAVLSDGVLESVYDADGKCVSGCAYQGITLAEDIENTTANTYAALNYISTQNHGNNDIQHNDNQNDNNQQPEILSPTQQQESENKNIGGVPPPYFDYGQYAKCTVNNPVLPNPNTQIPANPPIAENIRITSDFGPRVAPKTNNGHGSSNHKGLDIGVPIGTNVYAAANGTIERIWDSGTGGLAVLIRHDGTNFHTAYFHLSDNKILSVGDKVNAGCLIAKSGNTGNSSGPHLHYTVYYTAPGKKFDYSASPIDPVYPNNYLGVNYRYVGKKSSIHNGKILPGEIK